MTISFKWRIIGSLWLASVLFTALTGVSSAYILLQNERRLVEESLQNTATTLTSMGITDYTGLTGFEKLNQVIRTSLNLEQFSQTIQIYTKRGKLMLKSSSGEKNPFWINFFPLEKTSFLDFYSSKSKYKVLITSYIGKNGKQYYLHLSQKMPDFSDIAKRTWVSLLGLLLVMNVLAFFVAQMLSKKLLVPVKVVADFLNQLDPANPAQDAMLPIPEAGDYLTDIVSGVNRLTRRVKTVLYRLSRTRRYLVHELVNPLTILTGEADEVLHNDKSQLTDYKRVVESSLEELARMQNVIETVTKIARVERTSYKPTLLNVSQWLNQQKQAYEKIIKRDVDIKVLDQDVLVMLEPDLLFRLVENLLRNIAKHTQEKAVISLEKKKQALLIIEDSGPGMPQDQVDALNEGRDIRVGIGLALCLEIASICHFEIKFENKPEGGLKVLISLD